MTQKEAHPCHLLWKRLLDWPGWADPVRRWEVIKGGAGHRTLGLKDVRSQPSGRFVGGKKNTDPDIGMISSLFGQSLDISAKWQSLRPGQSDRDPLGFCISLSLCVKEDPGGPFLHASCSFLIPLQGPFCLQSRL